jgi:hypothetical protein
VFHSVDAMNKRHHWWDGHAGRMARRDIFVYDDGAQWLVEARQGGSEGQSRWLEAADEEAALLAAHDLMKGETGWRDLSSLIGAISPIKRKQG